MKKFFLLLVLVVVFFGCLLQPQILIKSASVEGDSTLIELHSNKQVDVKVQLSSADDEILCDDDFSLIQGANKIKLNCVSFGSTAVITVFAGETVFSDEIQVEFNESSLDNKIFSLAESKTPVGKMLKVIDDSLLKQNECNARIYINNLKDFYELSSLSSDSLDVLDSLDSQQISYLEKQISNIESCSLVLKREISNSGSKKFLVSYSIKALGECFYQGYSSSREFEDQDDIAVIEVNLNNNSAQLISGQLTSTHASKEEIQEMTEAFEAVGACFKALMMGVSIMNSESPQKESECTFISSNIKIQSVSLQDNFLVFGLINLTENEIQLNDVTTSVLETECVVCPYTLKPGVFTAISLSGDFSSFNVKENFTFNYFLNDFDYSEIAVCSLNSSQVEKDVQEQVVPMDSNSS